MHSFNGITPDSYVNHQLPSKQEALLNTALPFEVIKKAFLYLNDMDLHAAVLVNCMWKKVSINTADSAKHAELSWLKHFVDCLFRQKPFFFTAKDYEMIHSQSVMDAQLSTYRVRKYILYKIKKVKIEHLHRLKRLFPNTPTGLIDILVLAKLHRKIHEAKKIKLEFLKIITLNKLSMIAQQEGHYVEAIQVMKILPEEMIVNRNMMSLFEILIQRGDFYRAIQLADNKLKPSIRIQVFEDIFLALIQSGHLTKALEVAHMIPEDDTRCLAFEEVEAAFKRANAKEDGSS
jgi:hypothetical protein